jgi:hypothetical protein
MTKDELAEFFLSRVKKPTGDIESCCTYALSEELAIYLPPVLIELGYSDYSFENLGFLMDLISSVLQKKIRQMFEETDFLQTFVRNLLSED